LIERDGLLDAGRPEGGKKERCALGAFHPGGIGFAFHRVNSRSASLGEKKWHGA